MLNASEKNAAKFSFFFSKAIEECRISLKVIRLWGSL